MKSGESGKWRRIYSCGTGQFLGLLAFSCCVVIFNCAACPPKLASQAQKGIKIQKIKSSWTFKEIN